MLLFLFLSDINISNKANEATSYPVRYISLSFKRAVRLATDIIVGRRHRIDNRYAFNMHTINSTIVVYRICSQLSFEVVSTT
jgi:hypothetical protein